MAMRLFDIEDTSTWTPQSLKHHLVTQNKNRRKILFTNFFGWTEEDYRESKRRVRDELQKNHLYTNTPFPRFGPAARMRTTIQSNLLNDWPDLFSNRHNPHPPEWFHAPIIQGAPSAGHAFESGCMLQIYISYVHGHRVKGAGRNDDEDEYGPPPAKRVLRSRTTLPSSSSAIPAPDSIPTSPINATVTALPAPSNLTVYITRVIVIDHHLILERDRFTSINRLFEEGQLHERRFRELVFGRPLDGKAISLWWFKPGTAHDGCAGKIWSARNRLTAEAAIDELRDTAMASTGIQLFDAQDRDVMALIPVEEATRQDDFEEVLKVDLKDSGSMSPVHESHGGISFMLPG